MAMKQSVAVAKLIQIHDVPDDVHAELRRRAAADGMSLSAYLRSELERITSTPLLHEILDRIMQREPVDLGDEDPTAIIRAARDAGEEDDDLGVVASIRKARDAFE